jgi:hypothetical protein
MRKPKQPRVYSELSTHYFRPEVTICPSCQTRLRRHATLSERTVITLQGPLRLIHRSSRCPNPACATPRRIYRSVTADALALPGFTFGVDIVILIGHLRLTLHRTLDEVHQALLERLAPFTLTISRREVLYLFDAYCSLLRAAGSVTEDIQWRAQVEQQGGIILSIDGIQPDKGNETVYLVRDVLTGRVLSAENVSSSETAVIKCLLAPVVALGVPVIGAISDAQESLEQAIAELWPTIPHQTCQFHYLREATRPIHDADCSIRTAMRKDIQNKVRETRAQLARHIQAGKKATEPEKQQEGEQLRVLADYALGIQTALNFDGPAPFEYPGIRGYDALTEIEMSLQKLERKGDPVSRTVGQKLERLKELVGLRKQWQEAIDSLKYMRDWVLTAEHILSGVWADSQEPSGNACVRERFDQWCAILAHLQTTGSLNEQEQHCLTHFLQITHNLHPHLFLCYDRPDFPRTNNDMESYIRLLKTRYRRISGRKNWNNYLLRYGRCVAYYDCLRREVGSDAALEIRLKQVSHPQWQATRFQCRDRQNDQLKRWRFRHKREHFLRTLEQRWAATGPGT